MILLLAGNFDKTEALASLEEALKDVNKEPPPSATPFTVNSKLRRKTGWSGVSNLTLTTVRFVVVSSPSKRGGIRPVFDWPQDGCDRLLQVSGVLVGITGATKEYALGRRGKESEI